MAAHVLVLMQFEVGGGVLTTYEQQGSTEHSLYRELHRLYAIVFKDQAGAVGNPLGGLLIKSNLSANDPKFYEAVDAVARSHDVVQRFWTRIKGFTTIPTNVEGSDPLNREDMERLVGDVLTIVWANWQKPGHA